MQSCVLALRALRYILVAHRTVLHVFDLAVSFPVMVGLAKMTPVDPERLGPDSLHRLDLPLHHEILFDSQVITRTSPFVIRTINSPLPPESYLHIPQGNVVRLRDFTGVGVLSRIFFSNSI